MKIAAKKSLGQHFLNSRHVLEKIINAANPKKEEKILEIGPGTGFLTEALLAAGANVIAIEKDRRAVSVLREKFTNEIRTGQLELIEGDVLEIEPRLDTSYSIVANIPYYITGAILSKFLECKDRPTNMTLLVQREVADRIVAKTKESILSLSVKAFGDPSVIACVPRGAFTPPPKVDSAIMKIEDISDKSFTKDNISVDLFFKVIKTAFAHKRKLAIRNLGGLFKKEDLKEIWCRLMLAENVRAEDIHLEKWLKITKFLQILQDRQQVVE